jgi:hypothetical protein
MLSSSPPGAAAGSLSPPHFLTSLEVLSETPDFGLMLDAVRVMLKREPPNTSSSSKGEAHTLDWPFVRQVVMWVLMAGRHSNADGADFRTLQAHVESIFEPRLMSQRLAVNPGDGLLTMPDSITDCSSHADYFEHIDKVQILEISNKVETVLRNSALLPPSSYRIDSTTTP